MKQSRKSICVCKLTPKRVIGSSKGKWEISKLFTTTNNDNYSNKNLKGKNEPKLEFRDGGVKTKNPTWDGRGMSIFWNHTMLLWRSQLVQLTLWDKEKSSMLDRSLLRWKQRAIFLLGYVQIYFMLTDPRERSPDNVTPNLKAGWTSLIFTCATVCSVIGTSSV